MKTEIKPGVTLIFTADDSAKHSREASILKNNDNFIRINYLKETGLSTQNIGTRCIVTKVGMGYIVLLCPNGEYEFLKETIILNFKKCPREEAFKILNI